MPNNRGIIAKRGCERYNVLANRTFIGEIIKLWRDEHCITFESWQRRTVVSVCKDLMYVIYKKSKSSGKIIYNSEIGRYIPDGWEVATLKGKISISRGISYLTETLSINEEGVPMINPRKSIFKNGIM